MKIVSLVLVSAVCAVAQTTTGIIQGTVHDPTGAAVPDAIVTIVNEGTNVSTGLHTNADGRYVAPFLLPGQYRVQVEKTGFQKFSQSGIKLDVQQEREINVTLAVGEVTTTVEVQGAPPPLSTTATTVATVIENKRILDMPLNGRNPFNLALLTPGVIGTSGTSIPWISGGRNATSEISIDGTSIILPENNVSINTLAYTPAVDAVEEFSVLTNSLAAEYGRTGGGVINVATKSGTNSLRGTLYEFMRNSELDANGFFPNRSGTPRRSFQRNQFGVTLGGPVVVPKVYDGRNRTFFFVDYQGQRNLNPSTLTATVPLEEWKRGDFSNLRTAAGQPILVYDPLTTKPDNQGNYIRDAFTGNRIPDSQMDLVGRNLMKFFPAPNAPPANQFTQVNNWFASGKSVSNNDRYDFRFDQNFTQKWRAFGRFSASHDTSRAVNFYGNPGTPNGSGPGSSDNHSASFDQTFTFSPTLIADVRYGFGRFYNLSTPFSRGFDLTSLGFPSYVAAEAANFGVEFPRFDINGLTSLGQATFTSLRYAPNSHIVHADLTKVWSRHTVKGGTEYRKMLLNFRQLGSPSGSYSFDQRWTQRNPVVASSTEGFGLASLLIGVPSSGSISHDPATAMASSYWGFYIQDDFRATNSLTLNLGLRYDIDVPRTERYNRLSYFDPDAPSPIAGKVTAFPNLKGLVRFAQPGHRQQTPTDLNNFGPRFGFAWKLGSKMVARGAYGLMYSGSALQAAGASGTAGTDGFSSSTNFITSLDSRTPINFLSNPYPDGFNLPLGAADGPISGPNTNLGLGISGNNFIDYRNPVIQQWNFNLQRELGGSLVLEAGYLASKGNHLIDGEGSITYNQLPAPYFALGNALNDQVPNPFFGVILNSNSTLSRTTVARSQLFRLYPQYTSVNGFRKPQANSLYHAFTLRAEKRYSRGLGLLLAYTAGKLIDDASQTVTFLGPSGNKQDFYNRRAERAVSTQDVSSRLVMSFVYDLPFGRGRALLGQTARGVNFVVGGWQFNGIVTFQTGTPVILTQTQNNTGLGSPGQRPNNNGTSAKLTGGAKDQRLNRWFDPTVFSFAPPFTFGNVGRTLPDVRNPGTRNFDLSLFKNFRFREDRLNTQFRVEAFNAMNTTQFNAPAAVVGNSNIGVISGAAAARQVQLALKVIF